MKRSTLLITMILLGLTTLCQDSQLSMKVSKETVAVGERFRLSITLKGESSPIVPPKLDGFSVLSGPNERTSTELSNRGFSFTKTVSYIIQAEIVGNYTIGAAESRTNKGRIRSNTVDITVVEPSNAAKPSDQTEQTLSINMPNGFKLMSFLSKNEVVVGEPVLISYVLYSNENNVQLQEYRNPPQHEGFISNNTTVNEPNWVLGADATYKKMHLADQILIPLESGTFQLDPYVAKVAKVRFFSGNQYTAKSDPLEVKVKPLPEGSSSLFHGAVGDMRIQASLSDTIVETNAPVHLQVRITGSGNLETLSIPDLDLPAELESYEPEISDKLSAAGGTIHGSRTFDYLIIPRSPGEHSIPPIRFEYYDTQQQRYIDRRTNELRLLAEGDQRAATIERPGGPSDTITELDSTSIDEGLTKGWLTKKSLYVVIGAPLLAFLLFFGVKRLKERSKDKALLKSQQADRIAKRILSEARIQKEAGNTSGFYSSLYQAMNRYVEQKLQIPKAEMNRERVSKALLSKSVDDATLIAWSRILDQCEMAAYSRVGVKDPESLYREVSSLIKSLEAQL